MKRHGFDASPIHGDLDQSLRTKTLDRFRSGELQFLIASDVAARGLDIPDVSHVFNYEPPRHADDYVHRIGRTGRAGRSGAAFTLVGPSDSKSIAAIEQLMGLKIEKAEIEGLPEAALGDPRDSGGRGRRAEELKREHGKRLSEKKQRYMKRDDSRGEAATEPVKVEPSEAKPERTERPRSDRPREERPRNERPREDRQREDRPQRPERREDRREDRGPQVQGFGDNTPAFLRGKK